MIAFVDVDYREKAAVAACVLATSWHDDRAAAEIVAQLDAVAEYEPGQFYKRELPCLLAVLNQAASPPAVVVVDGYVWLGDGTAPGLGARLFEALGTRTAVVGVAKTRFRSATAAREVFRPGSKRPLYVTAAGIASETAAQHVAAMHGPFRIPTLLKRVDQLCRGR